VRIIAAARRELAITCLGRSGTGRGGFRQNGLVVGVDGVAFFGRVRRARAMENLRSSAEQRPDRARPPESKRVGWSVEADPRHPGVALRSRP